MTGKEAKKEKGKRVFPMIFDLRSDMADYEEIEATIASGSKIQGTNACILMMAILVASVGLNTNSTAVIIGAMLISPLMGGIIAIGYGIATNNLNLARFSAIKLSIQVIISIVTSFVYFSISPINTASSELLARTSPTVWDVLIAISGGFAGIIGQTRKEKSNVIPGVAIATALMPPLCTAGYGLAQRNWQFFTGALYLFFINGFFICLTAVVVLKIMRVPQFMELTKKQLGKIHRTIALIAVITMLPSVYFAYDMIHRGIENRNAESYIKNEFIFSGTHIVQKTVDIDDKRIEISLIGKEISEETQAELTDRLGAYDLEGYKLEINQTTVKSGITAEEVQAMLAAYEETDDEPNVDEILTIKENEELSAQVEELTEENSALRTRLEEQQDRQIDTAKISSELSAIDPRIVGAVCERSSIVVNSIGSTEEKVLVTLLTSARLSSEQLDTIKNWLGTRLETSELVVFQQDIRDYRPELAGPQSSSAADSSSESSSESSSGDNSGDSSSE
ncbi:MAG: DUF389 domain-containing protein [Ruminococcus sp.]|nr:DUF389 domain-containing protein [Ruminococcus sp.]